jgi:hypothetical protein
VLKSDQVFQRQHRSKSKRRAASIRFFTRRDVYEEASRWVLGIDDVLLKECEDA